MSGKSQIRAKNLNLTDGYNRFRFSTFQERIKDLKINVAHRIIKDLDEPDVNGSYFQEALLKWKELNCTSDFANFYSSVVKHSHSLSQILHHKTDIIQLLIDSLKVRDSLAYEPLLNLVTLIARDLQQEFYPFFLPVMNCIVDLLPNSDSDSLEWIYNAIAYLFKYLSKELVQDIIPTFQLLEPQFKNSKPFIRMFAAEAFGFLLRKLKPSESAEVYAFILQSLREETSPKIADSYCEGLAVLFFEIVKQVNHNLHSRVQYVLKNLFELIIFKHNEKDDSAFVMLQKLCILIGNHSGKDHFSPIWELVQQKIDLVCSNEKSEHSLLILGKLLSITNTFVTIQKGTRIIERKMVFKLLEKAACYIFIDYNERESDFAVTELVKSTSSLLETSSLETSYVYGRKIADYIFECKTPMHVFSFCQILRLRNWFHFSKIIIPRILSYVQSNHHMNPPLFTVFLSTVFGGNQFEEVLSTIPSHMKKDNLVKIPEPKNGGDNITASILKNITMERNWNEELNKISSVEVEDDEFEKGSPSAITSLASAVSCLNYLYIRSEDIYTHLVQLFTNIVNTIKSNEITAGKIVGQYLSGDRRQILLALAGNVLTVLSTRSVLCGQAEKLKNIWDLVMFEFTNLAKKNSVALTGVYEFVIALQTLQNTQYFNVAMFEKVFEILENNIGSFDSSVRLYTLRILTGFKQYPLLPNKESSMEGTCMVLNHCLEMESIENSIGNIREKNIVLRRLEALQISKTMPKIYECIVIKYCLALLSLNFMPLVEECTKTLCKIAELDVKRFWNVYQTIFTDLRNGSLEQENVQWLEFTSSDEVVMKDCFVNVTVGKDGRPNQQAKDFSTTISFEDIAMYRLSQRVNSSYGDSRQLRKWLSKNFVENCSLNKNKVDMPHYYLLLIRILSGIPHIIEQRSHFIVPFFLQLFKSRIDSGEIPIQEIPRGSIVENQETLNLSAITAQSNDIDEVGLRKQILEFLTMFSRVKKPEKLYNCIVLKSIFFYLLSNGENAIQEKSLDCILAFKNPTLVLFQTQLVSLIEDEKFRDSLSGLSAEDLKSKVKIEDRQEFMMVLSRILYGKLVNKKGKSSGRAGLKARRTAIFSFAAGLNHEDNGYLLNIMTYPFEKVIGKLEVDADLSQFSFIDLPFDDLISILPSTKMQIGFLNVLEDLVKQFKSLIIPFTSRILNIILHLLYVSEHRLSQLSSTIEDKVEEADEEDSDNESEPGDDRLLMKQLKDIRTLSVKRLQQLFNINLEFDFKPYVSTIFDIFITSRIPKLATENTQASSALLELLACWSRNRKYAPYLNAYSTDLIPQLFNILAAKKVQDSVISRVLDIVEAVIAHDNEEEDVLSSSNDMEGVVFETKLIDSLIVPNVDYLLENLKLVLQTLRSRTKKLQLKRSDSIPNRIVLILSQVSKYVKNPMHADQLVDMLLPFLKNSSKQVSELMKGEILHIIGNFVPILPNLHTETSGICKSRHYIIISSLFATLETRKARKELLFVFGKFKEIDSALEPVLLLLEDLNSFSARRMDEPDFDRRFSALQKIGGDVKRDHYIGNKLTADQFLPLLHNLLYFVHDVDEYSIRGNASGGIMKLITRASQENKSQDSVSPLVHLIMFTALPGIKFGIQNPVEAIRQDFIKILHHLIVELPQQPQLSDMTCLLGDGNEEQNFFLNIYHLQSHRRTHALKKITDACEAGLVSEFNINSIFIPIIDYYIFNSDRMDDHQIINIAINALAACAGSLPWNHYHGLLRRYISGIEKKPLIEKLLVRVIVAVIGTFHFSLRSEQETGFLSNITPQVVQEGINNSRAPNVEAAQAIAEDGILIDENMETADVKFEAMIDVEEEERKEQDEETQGNSVIDEKLMSKIHDTIVEKIIPTLHKLLAKKEEEALEVRVPVALAITKLLKQLPAHSLHMQLPKLVLTLCNILKSRQQSARDTTRKIIVQISIELGMAYVPYIVKELKGALLKGYQLHVLGYTIHSLLIGIIPTLSSNSPELEYCSDLLASIFVSDIFGEVGQEREVAELRGKMTEIRKTKSFDSFELLSSVVAIPAIKTMLLPLKELMIETNNTKVTTKIDEILKRMTIGLNSNSYTNPVDLMVFIHGLVTESLSLSKLEESFTKKPTQAEKNFKVQMKRQDLEQPLKYFEGNAFRFINFGFSLMHTALKRSKLDLSKPEHLSLVDPLVVVLGRALYSKHSVVIVVAVKILSIIANSKLPSIGDALPVVVKRVFELISRSVSTASDLVQALFKLLTVILRDCKKVEIKEKQLIGLIMLIKPDLEEPERQTVTFSLIRSILLRKYVVNEVYDLIDDVSKIMVTSQSSQVRVLCRYTYFQFLEDYPQGKKRLQAQFNFMIKNLQYEFESGRESVMELLSLIVSKFPEEVLSEYSEVLFVALVVSLINDDSSKCREMAGLLIKQLLARIGLDKTEKLWIIVDKWFEQLQQPQMLRTAAQVYGLVVETFGEKFKKFIPELLKKLVITMHLTMTELEKLTNGSDEDEMPNIEFLYWESGYYALTTLGKILKNFPSFSMDNKRFKEVWEILFSMLLHPHQWLRSLSSRIFGVLFANINPATLSHQKTQTPFPILNESGRLNKLALRLCNQLKGELVSEEMGVQVVKNLFFIAKCMHLNRISDEDAIQEAIELDEDGNDSSRITAASPSLLYVIRKFSYFSRMVSFKDGVMQNHILRSSIFRWYGTIVSFVEEEELIGYLMPMVSSMYRSSNDESSKGKEADQLKKLSDEVLDMVEKKIGSDKYLEMHNVVRAEVLKVRRDRKQQRQIDAVSNPIASAKRKLAKNEMKKNRKKRKIGEFMNRKDRF